ncbi:MAG: RNA-binding transcriptional accessory protein [Bacteroidaceae bacterium]|nr:RNA-binding transcriptional accessory protein [Bacteroidaceae bacterium]
MSNDNVAKRSQLIAERTGLKEKYVRGVVDLLQEGATVPFISRYRKEATGGMTDVEVAQVAAELDKVTELEHRKEFILSTIEGQGKLTPELRDRIENCWDATTLEDIYLPYKQKRRTRAQVAREAGLEPLADAIMKQTNVPLAELIKKLSPSEEMEREFALQGAKDIIAERVSEDERARQTLRTTFSIHAMIRSKVIKGKDAEGQNFRDYFDWEEPLKRCSSHRLLAMRRGEAEGILRVSICVDDEPAMERIVRQFVRGNSESSQAVREAVEDGYKRLLEPSISNEFGTSSRQKADEEAIRIFVRNLEQLLMASPLGQKRVMAIDPGFRTGCKVVCLDAEGNLLHHDVIFPHPPRSERVRAMQTLQMLVQKYGVQAISIGNGTAGRETEDFVRHLDLPDKVEVYSVSEDGASIYSASDIARQEFPNEDVTVRGAVSIGRRLMDPLAELVKIDPSSIGVGQYQKDVNQAALRKSLEETVVTCVNRVGVNLNTASQWLLTYVSGLGPALAQNIVRYRRENGPFRSRKELMKVPRMGAKAFEQSAGFLRIKDGTQPLDNSAVHPERYELVEQMARDQHCTVSQLMADKTLRDKIDVEHYVSGEVGLPTLRDIMTELDKPGLDPRQPLKTFAFDETVHDISDLHEGQILPGIVTNITNFGAFVDIGVHIKGLVHVSQLADHFVKDPTTVVKVQQQVMVRVVGVDMQRERISLSMRTSPQLSPKEMERNSKR